MVLLLDIFDTKTMLAAVEIIKRPLTFLRDTFFTTQENFETETVEVDVIKGKRIKAPFVSPYIAGKVLDNQGFETHTHKPALLKPKRITNAQELLKRLPGEHVYSPMNAEDRAAKKLGQDLAKLEDSMTRAEEFMCAQALFTGSITQIGEGVSQVISFGLTNTETLAGTDKWDDELNSDPYADIMGWRETIVKKSGISPNIVLMASDVVPYFIGHPKIQKTLDIRAIELGRIKPELLPNGATYLGTLTLAGVDVYSYLEWYIDENDSYTEKPMVPAGKVVLASTNAQYKMLYGALVDVEQGVFAVTRYPRSWIQKDPSAQFVELQSRPLPAPYNIDSEFVATVI